MASKAAVAAVVRAFCKFHPKNINLHRSVGFCPHIYFIGIGKGFAFRPRLLNPKTLISLNAETIAALQAFRKRHTDAARLQTQYTSQPTTVDFSHYRSVLKNKAIVDEAEKLLKDFKPVTYDVSTHIKAIETFEAKAVRIPVFTVAVF